MIVLTKDHQVITTDSIPDGTKIALLFKEDQNVINPEFSGKMESCDYSEYAKSRLTRLLNVLAGWGV